LPFEHSENRQSAGVFRRARDLRFLKEKADDEEILSKEFP
jgi:hypothetical protein